MSWSLSTSRTELLLGSNALAFFSFSNALESGSTFSGLQFKMIERLQVKIVGHSVYIENVTKTHEFEVNQTENCGSVIYEMLILLNGRSSRNHFIHNIIRIQLSGRIILWNFYLRQNLVKLLSFKRVIAYFYEAEMMSL